MFGLQESLYHGVPMVAIPIVMDQFDNAKFVQKRELGLVIEDRHTFSAEELEIKIKRVIKESK